jgi:hypothetical protein
MTIFNQFGQEITNEKIVKRVQQLRVGETIKVDNKNYTLVGIDGSVLKVRVEN